MEKNNNPKNIAIVGPGAIGTHMAFMLLSAGHEVTLIGKQRHNDIDCIRDNKGITFKCAEFEQLKNTANLTKEDLLNKIKSFAPAMEEEKSIVFPFFEMAKEHPLITEKKTKKSIITNNEIVKIINDISHIPDIGSNLTTLKRVDSDNPKLKNVDLVITAVKDPNLNAGLGEKILDMLGEKTKVLVIANGVMPWVRPEKNFADWKIAPINNIYNFAEEVGQDRIIGGIAFYATLVGRDKNNQKVHGLVDVMSPLNSTRLVIGNATNKKITPELEEVASLIANAGICCYADRRGIAVPMFEKLAANLGNASVAAIFGQTVGESLDNPLTKILTEKLIIELQKVAGAHGGTTASQDEFKEKTFEFMDKVRNHKPSMALDVEDGRKTEREYIVDAVVTLSGSLQESVDVPVTKKISTLMRVVENQSDVDRKYNRDGLSILRSKIWDMIKKKAEEADISDDFEAFMKVDFDELKPQMGRNPKNASNEIGKGYTLH